MKGDEKDVSKYSCLKIKGSVSLKFQNRSLIFTKIVSGDEICINSQFKLTY